MASVLPSVGSPGTPPTPDSVFENGRGESSFRFTCDDYDEERDRDQDRHRQTAGSAPVLPPEPEELRAETPRSNPAAFLHPQHTPSLRPPSPESVFTMASEDGAANGAPSAPPAKNPFNFQTQFISTAPIKSVRCPGVSVGHAML